MAINNTEVEIKTKLGKKKFEEIKKWLEKNSKFIKSSHHIDDYYTPEHKSFLNKKYPYEWLTIRRRDGKILLNYKHWYPEGVKYTTHCDEYETEISDNVQMDLILSATRFKKFITVEKKRETFVYKKELEIALDVAKGLGYFIEVESLKDFGGIAKTHKALTDFLKVLGINETKTIPGGYAAELMRRKGLIKA